MDLGSGSEDNFLLLLKRNQEGGICYGENNDVRLPVRFMQGVCS